MPSVQPAFKFNWKLALTTVGIIVSALAVAFVINELLKTRALSTIDWSSPEVVASLGLGSLGYALISVLIAAAWAFLLKVMHPGASILDAMIVHASTQILKYLPSNVINQFGRAFLMKSKGTPLVASAGSSVAEALLIASAGAILTVLLSPPGGLPEPVGTLRLPAAVFVFFGTVAVSWVLTRYLNKTSGLAEINLNSCSNLVLLAGGYVCYFAFFLLFGQLLQETYSGIGQNLDTGTLVLVGAMAAAWTIGFLTPGAAAGIGVREGALIVLLSPVVGPSTASLLAVSSRAINIGGDLILALIGYLAISIKKP